MPRPRFAQQSNNARTSPGSALGSLAIHVRHGRRDLQSAPALLEPGIRERSLSPRDRTKAGQGRLTASRIPGYLSGALGGVRRRLRGALDSTRNLLSEMGGRLGCTPAGIGGGLNSALGKVGALVSDLARDIRGLVRDRM